MTVILALFQISLNYSFYYLYIYLFNIKNKTNTKQKSKYNKICLKHTVMKLFHGKLKNMYLFLTNGHLIYITRGMPTIYSQAC